MALYHALRAEASKRPPGALGQHELEIAGLVAQPSLAPDAVDILAKSFESESPPVLLTAARVLGAALSASDIAGAHARRCGALMARLTALSALYEPP